VETPGRPLTLAEAQERSRLLLVERYDVRLDLTTGDEVFRTRTEVRFACTEPGAATFVELRPAALLAASLNGEALDVRLLDGNRLPLAGLAADNVLVVEADMPYVTTGDGMHRFVDPVDGEVYVGAYLGVDNAQRVLACFDQPDLKAEVALTVVSRAGWSVVGNGLEVSAEGGVHVLEPTPRISPYLVAMVAGPLASVRTTHRGIPFHLHARRSLGARLQEQAEEILAVARECFDRYAEMFDEPYPFSSYGHAFVPELNWQALEQPGCVLVVDSLIFTSEVTDDERLNRALVLAHEMAHMWFGDLVTLRWWDDIWLNESFAEYMGYRLVSDGTGQDAPWVQFATTTKAWGYDSDRRRSSHPIAPEADDVADTEAAMNNFDGISYAKGASALRQLATWLGEDAFLAGINVLLTRHRFGSATLSDVLDALSEASGRDVHAWADGWLRTTGTDVVRVVEADGGVALEHPGVRPHRLAVGLYDVGPDGSLSRRDAPLVELPAGVGRVAIGGPGRRPDLLLVNDEDLTFASTRLDDRSEETLARSLSRLDRPLSRAVAWVHLRNRVREGDLDPRAVLAAVRDHLPAETDTSVVEGVLGFVRRSVVDRYLGCDDRDGALADVRSACEGLLAREGAPAGLRLAALRAWVESCGPDQASRLLEVRDNGWDGDGPADQDLRWRVLTRLRAIDAGLPDADDDAVAGELARDTTGDGPRRAAKAMASSPHHDAKEAAWAAMFDDATTSPPVLRAAAEGFWRASQPAATAPWVPRWPDAVVEVSARRGVAVAHALGSYGFPVGVVTDEMLEAVEAALADPRCTPALRRSLEDQHDDLVRALGIRARYPSPGA